MKKLIFFVGPILLLLSIQMFPNICIADERIYKEGYKNAKWGMSKEQVKRSFPDKIFEESRNVIFFPSNIAGEKVQITFFFFKSMLEHVEIRINVNTTNNENYISRFMKFEKLLIKKYGQPNNKIREGSDNKYIDDATSIATGDGIYLNTWSTTESKILLALIGDNFKLNLTIGYACIALQNEKKKAKENKYIDDL